MDQIKGKIIVCVWSDIKHEINEKHKCSSCEVCDMKYTITQIIKLSWDKKLTQSMSKFPSRIVGPHKQKRSRQGVP